MLHRLFKLQAFTLLRQRCRGQGVAGTAKEEAFRSLVGGGIIRINSAVVMQSRSQDLQALESALDERDAVNASACSPE